jgi:hypothetical protein
VSASIRLSSLLCLRVDDEMENFHLLNAILSIVVNESRYNLNFNGTMKDSHPRSCRQFLSKGILLDVPLSLAGIYDLAQFTPKAYMPPGKRERR